MSIVCRVKMFNNRLQWAKKSVWWDGRRLESFLLSLTSLVFFSPLRYRLGEISLSLQLSSAKKFKIVSIHISWELERTMVRERNSVQKIMKRFTFFLLLFLLHCWQIKRSKFVAVLLKEETRLGKWSEHLFLPKNWLRWIHHVPIKRVVTRRGKERLHCIDTGRKHDFRKRQQGRQGIWKPHLWTRRRGSWCLAEASYDGSTRWR